jgi:putative membrane protein insertion efficiency factor
MTKILLALIRLYQIMLSPYIGWHCRFTPTCSAYARDAILTHGALRGSWLAFKRILRCRPGGGSGEDNIPTKD